MPPARFSKRSGAGGVGALNSREMKITPTLERANSVTASTPGKLTLRRVAQLAPIAPEERKVTCSSELVAPHIARARPINCVRRREDNNEAV